MSHSGTSDTHASRQTPHSVSQPRALTSVRPAKPISVSFSRLLCTRTLPWLSALGLYHSLSHSPKASAVSVDALFCLYDTVTRATASPPRPSPTPPGYPCVPAPSPIAVALLLEASSSHKRLHALHHALLQVNPSLALPTPQLDWRPGVGAEGGDGARAAAWSVLTSTSSLLHAALAHATSENTPCALKDGFHTLRHFHTFHLLPRYVDSLVCTESSLRTLHCSERRALHTTNNLATPEKATAASGSGHVLEMPNATREQIMTLGTVPPLDPFFGYLLNAWRRAAEDVPVDSFLDDEDDIAEDESPSGQEDDCERQSMRQMRSATKSQSGDIPRCQIHEATVKTSKQTEPATDDNEEEEAVVLTTRAVLRTARRLNATGRAADESVQRHWQWLREASDALVALAATLLCTWANDADAPLVANVRTPSCTAQLYQLVDVMTADASFERLLQVLSVLVPRAPTTRDVSAHSVCDPHVRQSLVLALARAVDRAPTFLDALKAVETFWCSPNQDKRPRGETMRSARGLLPHGLPIVRALARRPVESHALRALWEEAVLEAPLSGRIDMRRSSRREGAVHRSIPFNETYWKELLTADVGSLGGSSLTTAKQQQQQQQQPELPWLPCSQAEAEMCVQHTIEGASLLFQQLLKQTEAPARVGDAVSGWFAQLCTSLYHSHSFSTEMPCKTNAGAPERVMEGFFDGLVEGLTHKMLPLFPSEAERVEVLAGVLSELPHTPGNATVRVTLLEAWVRAGVPGEACQPLSTDGVIPLFHRTDPHHNAEVIVHKTHLVPPRTSRVQGDDADTDAGHGVVNRPQPMTRTRDAHQETFLLGQLAHVMTRWITMAPHHMSEAVALLDDVSVAIRNSKASVPPSASRQLASLLASLSGHVRLAILSLGLRGMEMPSQPGCDATKRCATAMEMAHAWAALLATFRTTSIHKTLFDDPDYVVLLYWLLEALAHTRTHDSTSRGEKEEDEEEEGEHSRKLGRVALRATPPLSREALEAAASGLGAVVGHSPATSLLPPMLLNWLVSPDALGMTWKAATRFVRAAAAARVEVPAPARGGAHSGRETPKGSQSFLFLALPLDKVESEAHAVRVLLSLLLVANEAKSHVLRGPLNRARGENDAHGDEGEQMTAVGAMASLYVRIRSALFYTWYTRTLAAVIDFFRSHPGQLQNCGVSPLASSTSSSPDASALSHMSSPAMSHTLTSLEALPGLQTTLGHTGSGVEGSTHTHAVSIAVLCSYVLRERWVWQGVCVSAIQETAAPQRHATAGSHSISHEVASSLDVLDALTPAQTSDLARGCVRWSGRERAAISASTLTHELPLNELLLRDLVHLIRDTASHSASSEVPCPRQTDKSVRLLAALYHHATRHHTGEPTARSTRDDDTTGPAGAIRAVLEESVIGSGPGECLATRVLPEAEFAELCREMEALLASTEAPLA